jgi:hypothetical protein
VVKWKFPEVLQGIKTAKNLNQDSLYPRQYLSKVFPKYKPEVSLLSFTSPPVQNTFKKKIPWLLVLKRTIPTERPPLVSEVNANFCE